MSAHLAALVQAIGDDPAARAALVELLRPELEGVAARLAGQGEDGWMDTRAAAEYLGMSPNALHKLTAAREIPFEQAERGGKCWFLRSELDAWRRGGGG